VQKEDARLPVRRGDIVRVTRIVSDDWWRCEYSVMCACPSNCIASGNLDGQKGLVPRLYLRPCLQEIMGVAIEPFNDGKENHLSLLKVSVLCGDGDALMMCMCCVG
jgi:hypothetical protein